MSIDAIDRELAYLQERAGAPRRPNLGCSTIAHDRLGFCAGCVPALRDGGLNGNALEANCWRLLALRDVAIRRRPRICNNADQHLPGCDCGNSPRANGPYPSSALPSDGA